MVIRRLQSNIQIFMASQSAGGVVLAIAAMAALLVSNSPWAEGYDALLNLRGEVRIGEWLLLSKPLLVWVNDLWMAVFFFLVGLEIKRELVEGELSSGAQIMLPACAALGGMAVPALIYAAINAGNPIALRGWAIPAATDIAFALGVLALLGSRVPPSLKVFLTAVAIMDDLGAIVVIAFFYTEQLHLAMLGWAAAGVGVLFLMNRSKVTAVGPYVLVGLLVWLFVLKSGVHATVAGVLTALAVPLQDENKGSPLRQVEHALHPWVAFLVLPVFAFVNAGVSLQGVSWATLVQSVPLGITAGLVLGKVSGVFGASWLLIRWTATRLPAGAQWGQLFAVCVLCGIGFTMSLFIGSLAFAGQGPAFDTQLKIGVLLGSVVSGVVGAALMLHFSHVQYQDH
jgi:Na+:H+ antiporter, NhaA family